MASRFGYSKKQTLMQLGRMLDSMHTMRMGMGSAGDSELEKLLKMMDVIYKTIQEIKDVK